MPYSSINVNEEIAPIYEGQSFTTTANGAAILTVRLEVEGSDPLFTAESDAMFQDILDRLNASTLIEPLISVRKRWTASRDVTPTP